MGKSPRPHSAAPSALGYYHQGLFALVALLDGGDDTEVSIETDDDVVLHGTIDTLHQLKHSLGTPGLLTLKNEGLWKTLAIWCGRPFDGSVKFLFVTCASVEPTSLLPLLTQPGSTRDSLVTALDAEARLVKREREQTPKGQPLPHAKRWPGCESYLALKPAERKALVSHISIAPDSFNAAGVPDQVTARIGPCVPPRVRPRVVERLIEWWDRQVVLSLLGRRARRIPKLELQGRIQELIIEHSRQGLPDDFSLRQPASVAAETGTVMAKQIAFVRGGDARLTRAVVARWRARNQREKWIQDDLTVAADLDEFDKRLREAWSDRFGPMKDDCGGSHPDVCCEKGRGLLDWSHNDAPQVVTSVRPFWTEAFLVQGSYQQLAEQTEVGWHPNYQALLATPVATPAAGVV